MRGYRRAGRSPGNGLETFVQRGVVYFVTESISSGDSMRTLATVLDEHIEAGLPAQKPVSD